MFDEVHRHVIEELRRLPDEGLDEPIESAHPRFKTKFEAIQFCPLHEMLHDGQIGLLRRLLGMKPIRKRNRAFTVSLYAPLIPQSDDRLGDTATYSPIGSVSYPAVRQNFTRTLDSHHHVAIGRHLRGDGNRSPPRPGDSTDDNRAVICWTGKRE